MNIKTKELDIACFHTLTGLRQNCTIVGHIHNCGDGQIFAHADNGSGTGELERAADEDKSHATIRR